MGYSHYWYTQKELDQTKFNLVVQDFKTMLPKLEHLGVKIAGGLGEGLPEITDSEICFNGIEKCGHTQRDLGIVWPADDAHGVTNLSRQHRDGNETKASVSGMWSWGMQINARTCGGDCSHETFMLVQKQDTEREPENGYYWNCTKTAYKPYDLAVNVCLVIAKHHLKDQIIIHSDGTRKQWQDAIQLCEHFLSYGEELDLDEKIPEKTPELPKVQTSQNNTINPGDVFYSSWGYDQTNIDYYKVTSISKTGKTCNIVRIGAKTVKHTGYMSEIVAPDPEKILKEKFWEGENFKEEIKEYRALIKTERDGKPYLRCGQVGGGYLRVYDTPMMATHYA